MATPTDFPASGRIISADDDHVVFNPVNTNYEWKLTTAEKYTGTLNQRIEALIRASARKVYTVPSGGNFVQPIFGPPRIVQGRVKYLDEQILVLQAGAPVIIELPTDDAAFDLANGPIALGVMVNAVMLPGARFELASQPVGR